MFETIHKISGLHPGIFLERELKKNNLSKGKFAISINEFPQTLVSIMKGKRRMNASLAIKIEQKLNLEEGFLMVLQVYYDISEIKKKNTDKPIISVFRPSLFWDTKIELINWEKQKNAVIKRVFERGNELEKAEITRFYKL